MPLHDGERLTLDPSSLVSYLDDSAITSAASRSVVDDVMATVRGGGGAHRAATGIPLPDAMVIATAVLTSSQVLVTDDRRMAAASRNAVPEVRVVILSEVAAV